MATKKKAPKAHAPKRVRKAAPSRAGIYKRGPFELPDSTPQRPVVALRYAWDFPVGRSLREDVLYVASVARTEAAKTEDAFLVGVARALDGIELAMRRHTMGELTERDRASVASIENAAQAYVATRKHDERWYGGMRIGDGLPAKLKTDRPTRIKGLLDFAKAHAIKTRGYVVIREDDGTTGVDPATRHSAMAMMMVSTAWNAALFSTRGRDRSADVRALTALIDRKDREDLKTVFDAEALVVCTLEACGVARKTAHNWLDLKRTF